MKPAETLTTSGFTPDVTYEPFIDGIRVGYKVTSSTDGWVTYVYLNPSSSGEGSPDVFLYEGPHDDPGEDRAVTWICPIF